MQYTKEYFIAKFEAIPDERWTTGRYINPVGDCCCALGHCGYRTGELPTDEGLALNNLLRHHLNEDQRDWGVSAAPRINDGEHLSYQQPTPKARILAALRDLP